MARGGSRCVRRWPGEEEEAVRLRRRVRRRGGLEKGEKRRSAAHGEGEGEEMKN